MRGVVLRFAQAVVRNGLQFPGCGDVFDNAVEQRTGGVVKQHVHFLYGDIRTVGYAGDDGRRLREKLSFNDFGGSQPGGGLRDISGIIGGVSPEMAVDNADGVFVWGFAVGGDRGRWSVWVGVVFVDVESNKLGGVGGLLFAFFILIFGKAGNEEGNVDIAGGVGIDAGAGDGYGHSGFCVGEPVERAVFRAGGDGIGSVDIMVDAEKQLEMVDRDLVDLRDGG